MLHNTEITHNPPGDGGCELSKHFNKPQLVRCSGLRRAGRADSAATLQLVSGPLPTLRGLQEVHSTTTTPPQKRSRIMRVQDANQ